MQVPPVAADHPQDAHAGGAQHRAADGGSWVNDIDLTPEHQEELARTGVIKLEGLMGPKALEFFRELCTTDEPAQATATTATDGVPRKVMTSRRGNVGNKHPTIEQIIRSPEFLRVMARLVPERLIFAKGMVFEVGPGDSGYGWHFGLKAFRFMRPTDPGYSVWIPLQEVGPRTGGGVAYVPADVWSGRERSKLVSHQLTKIRAAPPEAAVDLVDEMAAEYPHLSFLTTYENELLDTMGVVEPSFKPGDVLLFSRWVWHRSCSFLAVPSEAGVSQPHRISYTMRLVGSQSRVSKSFDQALGHYYKLRKQGGKGKSGGDGGLPPFGELEDGDLVANSPDGVPAF
jgi:hypothetical protein